LIKSSSDKVVSSDYIIKAFQGSGKFNFAKNENVKAVQDAENPYLFEWRRPLIIL
jgi:hypothetical protein